MTHSFANVLYLSICMLGNESCFYIRLLTFLKIKFLQINHMGTPSECQTVWIQIKTDILLSSSGFILFAKGYNRQGTKFSTGMQSYNIGKCFSVQYIISYTGWVVTWFLLGYTVRMFEYTVRTF